MGGVVWGERVSDWLRLRVVLVERVADTVNSAVADAVGGEGVGGESVGVKEVTVSVCALRVRERLPDRVDVPVYVGLIVEVKESLLDWLGEGEWLGDGRDGVKEGERWEADCERLHVIVMLCVGCHDRLGEPVWERCERDAVAVWVERLRESGVAEAVDHVRDTQDQVPVMVAVVLLLGVGVGDVEKVRVGERLWEKVGLVLMVVVMDHEGVLVWLWLQDLVGEGVPVFVRVPREHERLKVWLKVPVLVPVRVGLRL